MKIVTEFGKNGQQEITLPDGLYLATWGGYVIELTYKDKLYRLTTEDGVRGFGIKVVVTIKNGIATFDEIKN